MSVVVAILTRIGPKAIGALMLVALGGAIVFFETHHAVPGFRAWTFGMVALVFVTLTALTRGRVRDVMLTLVAFGMGITVLEAAATIIKPKAMIELPKNWNIQGPPFGWRLGQPGVIHARRVAPFTGDPIFDAEYTIDKTLTRHVAATDTGPALVFFGDSFTFGDAIADGDTLPQQVADLYGGRQRVLNLALSGYSPQQVLRAIEIGYWDTLIGRNPRAFVMLTAPFQAMRTSCKETFTNPAPRYRLADGRPVFDSVCYSGVLASARAFLEDIALYRVVIRPLVVRLDHADVDLYIRIVAEGARLAKEKYGVDTLVPYLRAKPGFLTGTGYDDDAIIAQMKSLGVDVVDMTLEDDPTKGILYEIKGDGHPSPLANRIRARMVVDALGARGDIPAPPLLEHDAGADGRTR